jgi:hypothetical protein
MPNRFMCDRSPSENSSWEPTILMSLTVSTIWQDSTNRKDATARQNCCMSALSICMNAIPLALVSANLTHPGHLS